MRNYFPNLLGNEDTKKRIGSSLENGRAPHAYLIEGPEGSGRLTLALGLAAAFNCERREDSSYALPCGVCNSCKKIFAEGHTDVRVLRRRPDKQTVGVEEIKNLRSDMFLSATEADKKVYIIRDAERMTPEAQNALLIVLEEPPPNIKIILLSSAGDKILTTVKSRAQHIAMARFGKERLAELLCEILEEAKALRRSSPEKFNSVLIGADGRLGRALMLMSPSVSGEAQDSRADALALFKALGTGASALTVYKAVTSLPDKRQELMQIIEYVLNGLRDIIAVKLAPTTEPLFFSSEKEAREMLSSINMKRAHKAFEIFTEAYTECTKNANVTALLTSLAASIKSL